jgi:hypothetical protein
MKPGRELDAIVAEKVFGWEVNKSRTLFRTPDGSPFWRGFDHVPASGGFRGDDGQSGWSPSTDIAVAWEVATTAELFSHKFCYYLWNDGEKWCVGDTNGQNNCLPHVRGESPAHAICLAALKAVNAP